MAMTVIKKCISFDDYIFDTYLSCNTHNNLSKYIQKLIILGHDAMLNKHDETIKKLVNLTNQNTALESEVRNLKMLVEKLKLNKKNISALTPDEIRTKYEFDESHDKYLEQAENMISKNPETIKGNYELFKNQTGLTLSLKEFNILLDVNRNSETKQKSKSIQQLYEESLNGSFEKV